MNVQEIPMITFPLAIKIGFGIICRFKGRSRRSLFWFFYLFTVLTFIPTLIFFIIFSKDILIIIGLKHREDGKNTTNIWPLIVLGILLVINIILFFPLIPIGIRRLHDIGKSGYYLLLILIPIAGIIVLIILLSKDSDINTNEYGISEKYIILKDNSLLSNSQISSDFQPYFQNQQNYEKQDIYDYQKQEYPDEKKEYFDPDYQGTNFYQNQQNYNYQNYEQGLYKKE